MSDTTPPLNTPVPHPAAAALQWLERRIWLLIPLFALPVVLPFFTLGLPRSIDGGLHLLRIAALDRHLRSGLFLPRWIPEMLLGYGYPLGNYYAPASYYVVEAFHLAGLSFYYAFIAAFVLFVLVAGFGMYTFALEIFGGRRWAALAAAAAYLSAPYLLVNIYNRGALAEAGAQALLPWVLWYAQRVFVARRPEPAALGLALTLALLATMHTISLLFVPILLLAFALALWLRHGRSTARLAWTAAALLAAMGVSAFFWLPLLLERGFVAQTGFDIARVVWLPRSAWTWQNFLDKALIYRHTSLRPIRLGSVQLALAALGYAAGLLGWRRGWQQGWQRGWQWLFWGGVAAVSAALVGAWSLPLWNDTILAAAQFPWRMLSILSLPLALFAGGVAALARPRWLQALLAASVVGIILYAQSPRLEWVDLFSPATVRLDEPVLALIDRDRGVLGGGEGDSTLQEFRPRWAEPILRLKEQPQQDVTPQVTLLSANDYDVQMQVSAPGAVSLRMGTLYFPGWTATLNGATILAPYPSTNLGLLTVDLPAGDHTLTIRWQGTPLETAANWVTFLTLAAVTLAVALRQGSRRWAILPALFLAAMTVGLLWQRPSEAVEPPATPFAQQGLTLLGARWDLSDPGYARIMPYWQVTAPPADGLRFHWLLLDKTGNPLSHYAARPYYNTAAAADWPVGTIMDDAYLLPLPDELAPGSYSLALALDSSDEMPEKTTVLFSVTLGRSVPTDPSPSTQFDARLGRDILLLGYDASVKGSPDHKAVPPGALAVARPGDTLELTLYWQPQRAVYDNLHAFVHLVDMSGLPVVQEDQSPGPLLLSPELWLPGRTYRDSYSLVIPKNAPAGLYWPQVGMYDFDTVERLPVLQNGDGAPTDHVVLPPVKLVNQLDEPKAPTGLPLFGDFATLSAYDVPALQARPGESLVVYLVYAVQRPTGQNLTRFLQLYNEELGMAAQSDGLPVDGSNPTWSWLPGEEVTEQVQLSVHASAAPGRYTLYLGMYDRATGIRTEIKRDGAPVPDNALPLAEIEVLP